MLVINHRHESFENLICSKDLNVPLFIISDFNDQKIQNNKKKTLDSFGLINFINEPTRISTNYFNEINKFRTTETTLDLIIHNGDLIENTRLLDCPFSDHDFVTASLKFPSTKPCLLTV